MMKPKLILLLAAVSLMCGCKTATAISQTGRNVYRAIIKVGETPFDVLDSAINVGENLKTNVTSAVHLTTATADAATK